MPRNGVNTGFLVREQYTTKNIDFREKGKPKISILEMI
jgi:hypothetical protein